jgi:hypothetical protein
MTKRRDRNIGPPSRTRSETKEREGRLRPGRPRRTSGFPTTGSVQRLLRLSRLVSRTPPTRATSSRQRTAGLSARLKRRAIVNVRYSSNRTKGGWKAHGRYLERESASGQEGPVPEDRLGLAKNRKLDDLGREWQEAGDKRLFKIIISPEDGKQADFQKTASDLIAELKRRTGSRIEWAGIVHRNTDHPHAHLMIRGQTESGHELRIPREVVRTHLRGSVQDSLTRQLGLRSLDDLERERDEEVGAIRVTSLDRKLGKQIDRNQPGYASVKPQSRYERERLKTLRKIGLAQETEGSWSLRSDFQTQLKGMKDLQDRARTLFQSGVAISDPHAPMEAISRSRKLIGRVLLNSEDEFSGDFQTAFETIDGKIAIIRHDATLRGAWQRGDLKPGNIVVIDSLKRDPERLYASVLGDGEAVLNDPAHLDKVIRRIRTMNLAVSDTEKGWLGQLSKAVKSREKEREL